MWFASRHPYNFHSTSRRIIPASFPLPPYITFLSVMLRVIVAPAAIIALSAISTPFSIVALHPIHTWSPIIIGAGGFKISFPDNSVILWKSVSITNMSHDIRQRLPNFICFPHIIWLCPVMEIIPRLLLSILRFSNLLQSVRSRLLLASRYFPVCFLNIGNLPCRHYAFLSSTCRGL